MFRGFARPVSARRLPLRRPMSGSSSSARRCRTPAETARAAMIGKCPRQAELRVLDRRSKTCHVSQRSGSDNGRDRGPDRRWHFAGCALPIIRAMTEALPADRTGQVVQVGSRVRLLSLSGQWFEELPADEKADVSATIGNVFVVTEIDECGYVWVGTAARSTMATPANNVGIPLPWRRTR